MDKFDRVEMNWTRNAIKIFMILEMKRNYDTHYGIIRYARPRYTYRHGKRFKSARTELMIEYREHPNSETHDRNTRTHTLACLFVYSFIH